MRKLLQLFVLLLIVPVLSACSLFGGKNSDKQLESYLPADSSTVVYVQLDDGEGAAKLREVANSVITSGNYSFADSLKALLASNFQLALGARVDSQNFAAAMNFEKPDLFENFVADLVSDGMLEFVSAGSYWQEKGVADGMKLFKKENIYFLARDMNVKGGLLRPLEDGVSLDGRLGYYYMDLSDFGADAGVTDSYLNSLGKFSFLFSMDAKSVSGDYVMNFKSGSDLLGDYTLNLANTALGKNVIAYEEEGGFSKVLEAVISGFYGAQQKIARTDADAADVSQTDFYQQFLDSVAKFGNLDVADVKAMFDHGFAYSLHNSGSLVPGMVFYLQLDDADKDAAKKLVGKASAYLDEVIAGLNALGADKDVNLGLGGLIKKDVKLVNGDSVQFYAVDLSVLPKETVDSYVSMLGFDLAQLKVELYFGVMGDRLLFALYPGFLDNYGKDVLVDNAKFQRGKAKVAANYGYSFQFFDVEQLTSMLRFYLDFARKVPALDGTDLSIGDSIVAFLKNFNYSVISTKKIGNDSLTGSFYLELK